MTARVVGYAGDAQLRAPVFGYGRSPAMDALADTREVSLMVERSVAFGPVPAGVTLWRHPGRRSWHVLPDPERFPAGIVPS